MFMAFLLRENPIDGWEDRPALLLGLVIGAAGLGNTLGIATASLLRNVNPSVTVVLVLVTDAVAVLVAALFYGLLPLVVLGLCAGLAQALAKLSLDALIQRDVPELVRTSAFARSETLLQVAWVLGGAIGIVLPLNGVLGLAVGAAIVAAGWLSTVRGLLASARHGTAAPPGRRP
jgi:hypothetical protein